MFLLVLSIVNRDNMFHLEFKYESCYSSRSDIFIKVYQAGISLYKIAVYTFSLSSPLLFLLLLLPPPSLVIAWIRVSLYSSGWPLSSYVVQASSNWKPDPDSHFASQVLGLQVCYPTPSSFSHLWGSLTICWPVEIITGWMSHVSNCREQNWGCSLVTTGGVECLLSLRETLGSIAQHHINQER